jgi:hypothetical protein
MRTDLWDQFLSLSGAAARILVTVTSLNADGTSSMTTAEGAAMRAIGKLDKTLPYNAWVQDGRVVDEAPNLPIVEVTV